MAYKGEKRSFNGRLVTFGYSYKFFIIVDGRELVFERDDEQQYRVLSEESDSRMSLEIPLIEAIIAALQAITQSDL